MTSPSGEITVKPEIMLLEDVLGEIANGSLRVPKFQRPFVWRPEQMINLFDSIERGYPIGSLLVWDTNRDLPSLDRIADVDIPPAPDKPISYLLDGHQRLSTLYGCLMRRPTSHTPYGQQEWMWNIYRTLGERERANRFRHWKQVSRPPENYLPMRAVLRTMDFLAYARDLSAAADRFKDLDALMAEAEQLAQRIKSYKMAVVRLVGGDLTHAVEVFSRLNSSGQSMTPDQMVSALTYRADGGDSLADRIGLMQESLGDVGYGQIPSITIFRSILAVAGEQDVQEARWEVLAQRVKDRLAEAADETELALHRAVQFLRSEAEVPLARLIPYNAQIMLLVAFFSIASKPSPEQLHTLVRWFWSTSWSGFFAGANTTQIKNALQEMRDFAGGRSGLSLDGQVARPFPERFDLRSARIRAFVLWELREFGRRLGPDGEEINAVELLARSDTSAYRHVISSGPSVSSPANRLIMPTQPGVSVRRALLGLNPDLRQAVLNSHGIPQQALGWLHEANAEGFIKERAAFLAAREREFMDSLGVEASPELVGGEADIDTE